MKLSDLDESVRARLRVAGRNVRVVSAGRMRGGRRSRAAGQAFENEVMRAAIEQREVVRLAALPGCGARFVNARRAIPLPMPCDVVGCLLPAGRSIVFDAKNISNKTGISLADPKIVKPHQAEFLYDMAMAGAVAGLLVKCPAGILWLSGVHLGPGRRRMRWDAEEWVRMAMIDFKVIGGTCG